MGKNNFKILILANIIGTIRNTLQYINNLNYYIRVSKTILF